MRVLGLVAVLLLTTAVAACQTSPDPASAIAPVAKEAGGPARAEDDFYQLGAGDKVRVITFGEPNLTGEFFVSDSGRVSLPLIGEIQAGGLTLPEFSARVTAALSNGFLKNPQVSAEVLNYRPFFILGEVQRPGSYPFTSGLTVTNAVATAGGFTYRANVHRVFVRGPRDGKEHVVPLTGATVVHPGDTIRIPERWF